ncbi:hydroxymethylbilane synthase [Haloechinothrix sp. LS1_15]|uniref:hydroxymethylbilane synthase n=1 Tax=Haloechinothrix sp. LS1_15 TaxID=2652248 RepID=UPI002947DF2D|nr:hydroxymethylbilane synthase [Haloechinothrix sp. LS1_15]MDV6012632.1 hydroxymethylbilane synthase [Haloechinothrix sp. LS1_15]
MSGTIRVGTRASTLALAQTDTVVTRLKEAGHDVAIVPISTSGDRSSAPISQIGVGVFTSALRDALHSDEIDVAVHSYKDLPTAAEEGLVIAAVPEREDPRDILVARDGLTLAELPPGAVLGTGSPRRAAQLRALGLGLEVTGIRGNIDTRMRKVVDGEVDGVVLARAGLARVGRLDEATETLDPLQMLPAPAQGALAVECRSADGELAQLLHDRIEDEATRAAVVAERAVLATLEAGCSAPVGALADVVSDIDDDGRAVLRLSLRGVAATAFADLTAGDPVGGDGSAPIEVLRATATGDLADAESLGAAVAAELLDRGAGARL